MTSNPQTESRPEAEAQPIVYTPETITTLPIESFPASPSPSSPQTSTAQTPPITWRTLLSAPHTPSTSLCAGLATCPPQTGHLPLHKHTQAEIYYITAGTGVVTINGTDHQVLPGSVVFIPGDAEHGVRTEGEEVLEWFYVFPTGSFGDVRYRFAGVDY